MANADPEENPLYARAEDLHVRHWDALRSRDPEQAARAAGAAWDGQGYTLRLLGRRLRVDPVSAALSFPEDPGRRVGYQRALVAVNYLARAVEAEPRGTWVAFRELPGGESFFRGPHSLATARLEACFGDAPAGLIQAASRLGGASVPEADAAVRLAGLPSIPLLVLLWGRTEEFSASAQLLIDPRAHFHLPLDTLWALSNLAVADLVREGSP